MLYTALNRCVQRYPHNVALVHKDQQLSYEQLWTRSDYLAGLLDARGVCAGDQVAILGDNSIDTVVAWWAVIKCNAVCVYLNEKLKASGIDFIARDCKPVLFICATETLLDKVPDNFASLCLEQQTWGNAVKGDYQSSAMPPPQLDNIASIVYTSGSTGEPKGVCLSHKNLLCSSTMSADAHELTETDKYLMVVPLHYVHGLMMLLSVLLRGGCTEFMNSFMFPSAVTKKIEDKEITGISGVPYHFSALMDRGLFLSASLPHLRWICITGGAMAQDRLLTMAQAKPQVEIHVAYGQTECSPRIARLHPSKVVSKPASVGQVESALTAKLVDLSGNTVAQGETGELWVRGDSVMRGYWNDPVGSAKVVDKQGWLHTGDLAYMDADGDLFIRGRVQAMIKTAGERIFPEELEALINQHPEVAEVAVVGLPDELYGQLAVAHVVLNSKAGKDNEASAKQIEAFCLQHVPFARAPRRYQLWDEFPLKANGKVDKQQLIAEPGLDYS